MSDKCGKFMCGEYTATLSDIKGKMQDMEVMCGSSAWLRENTGSLSYGVMFLCICILCTCSYCDSITKVKTEE